MKATILMTSAAIAVSTGATGQTPPPSLAVPAFFSLSTNSTDWMRILQAGRIAKIVVVDDTIGTVGIGTGCTSSPTAMFDCLRQNGQFVFGYVLTNSGQRAQTNVLHGGDGKANVDQWYNTYCPTATACHIDGIFFDVGPDLNSPISESSQKTYYHSLYQAVTTRPNATGSCGNPPGTPGTHPCVMINASQFPNNWVMSVADLMSVADYVVLYERPVHGSAMVNCPPDFHADSQNYVATASEPALFCPSGTSSTSCSTTQIPNNWYFDRVNAARIAHVLFSATADDINTVIAKSRSSYGSPGFLYIHDQDCDAVHGAVYSRLPTFFEQVVAALDTPWQQVQGSLSEVGAASDGTVWGVNAAGNIWHYVGPPVWWEQIQGSLSWVSAGRSNGVWGVNSANYIWQYVGAPEVWHAITGSLSNISVAADGSIWGVNSAGAIWQYVGAPEVWHQITGSLSNISVGSASNVWGVNSAGQIWHYVGGTEVWEPIPGGLSQISAASDGTVVGVNSAGEIWQYVGGAMVWQRLNGGLAQISAASNYDLWGVDFAGNIYHAVR